MIITIISSSSSSSISIIIIAIAHGRLVLQLVEEGLHLLAVHDNDNENIRKLKTWFR